MRSWRVIGVAHVHDHALAVDVRGLQRQQLRDAQPGTVEEHEHGAVLRIPRVLQERRDLLATGHVGLVMLDADGANGGHRPPAARG
jgi:hypothetical protein